MNHKIFSVLKTAALALVLSIGISYVSAWTAPTMTPPNGNVAAPINVGSTAQTKSGNLTANYLTASSESNAPVFKDTSDPTYFLNPNNDSVLQNVYAKGDVCSGWGLPSQKCLSAVSSAYSAGNGLSLSGTIFSINNTQTQSRVSGSCAVGSSIRAINADGTVSCEASGSGTGLSGVLAPLRGKQIQCSTSWDTMIAKVDANGVPSVYTPQTGWTYGTFAYADDGNCAGNGFKKASWDTTKLVAETAPGCGGYSRCVAYWPAN